MQVMRAGGGVLDVNDQKVVAGIRHQLGNDRRSDMNQPPIEALALEQGMFEGVVQCHDG